MGSTHCHDNFNFYLEKKLNFEEITGNNFKEIVNNTFPHQDPWRRYLNYQDCIMLTFNVNKIALREFTPVFLSKYLLKRIKLLSVVNLHLSGAWAMSSTQMDNETEIL
jgi:hypothetical protein